MMHVAMGKGRITVPVMLEIKLEVVSRPGVLFSDCNASRKDVQVSRSPQVVHFDVVKQPNQFGLSTGLRRFYQAEVLVPSPLPPSMITAVVPVWKKRKKNRSS